MLPTLKEKKRYIVFNVQSNAKIKMKNVENSIKNAMLELYGELGLAKSGLMFLPTDIENYGILRTNIKTVDMAKTAMLWVQDVNNKKVIIKSIKVSGILNKARKFIGG